LFTPASLLYAKIPLSEYEDALIRECTPKETRRMLKMLKRTVKEYDMLGVRYSKNAVKEIRKEYR
jgi:hypothetical protein